MQKACSTILILNCYELFRGRRRIPESHNLKKCIFKRRDREQDYKSNDVYKS